MLSSDGTSTTIPHHADAPKHHALCRGRPLWYLLMQSNAFQSYVQNRWLDLLFPVVAANTTGAVAPTTSTAMGDKDASRADRSYDEQQPTAAHGVSMTVLGVSTSTPPPSGATDQQPSPQRQHHHKYCDYAQAPFNESAHRAATLRGGAHDIPTAFPNMSCKREHLLKAFKSLVGGPAVPVTSHDASTQQQQQQRQPQKERTGDPTHGYLVAADPTTQGQPVVATSDGRRANPSRHGSSAAVAIKGLSLNPNSRVTSTMLLREEIARTRQQNESKSATASSELICGSTAAAAAAATGNGAQHNNNTSGSSGGGDACLLSTPMLSRYRMWVATNRTRTQQERYVEVAYAVAQAMQDPGPMATMQGLVSASVQHPIAAYKAAMERGEENDHAEPDGALHAFDDQQRANTIACIRKRFYDPAELALLELTVFGYLPAAVRKRLGGGSGGLANVAYAMDTDGTRTAPNGGGGSSALSNGNSALPQLRTAPADLAKARHALRKRDPLDRAVTVELLLRHGGIKRALQCWWSCLPKHMQQRPQSPPPASAASSRSAADAAAGAPHRQGDVLSRATFDCLMVHVHCAFVGGTLPFAAHATLDSLQQLAHDDWVYLFAAYANATSGGGSGNGGGGNPPVPQTERFRSLLLRGMECPICLDEPLFQVALLLLIEPWMETTAPEERELSLAFLFQRCFVCHNDGGAPSHTDSTPAMDVFRLRPLQDDDGNGGASPVRPRSAHHDGDGRLSPSKDATRVGSAPRRPGQHPIKPLTELVEQLDAALDRRLAAKQAARNRMEDSDTTHALTADAWRSEVLQHNLQQAYRNPHTPAPGNEQPLLKPFSPHDPSRSFGLERVMLQRLTKRVVSGCTDAAAHTMAVGPTSTTTATEQQQERHGVGASGLAAAEQANIVVHAAKRLIPHGYLHDVARYHRSVVASFRSSVAMALTQYHHHQCAEADGLEHGGDDDRLKGGAAPRRQQGGPRGGDGRTAVPEVDSTSVLDSPTGERPFASHDTNCSEAPFCPPQLLDVQELAAYLAPPPLRGYERALRKEAPSAALSRYFVRRPRSATPTARAGVGGDVVVSESVRRPLSALHGAPAALAPAAAGGQHQVGNNSSSHPAGHAQRVGRPSSAMAGTSGGSTRGSNPPPRPLSAADRVAQQTRRVSSAAISRHRPPVLYVSPYMHRGALPVSNGAAYASRRRPVSAAASPKQPLYS